MNYRKIPVLNKIIRKFDKIQNQIDNLSYENFELCSEVIRLKHLEKYRNNEKINLVFVCHRPQVWNSLKTVFEQCNADPDFNVTIVAIPLKKQLPKLGFNHEIYETEGAEEFWKDFPCKVLNGYNYETKEWFDLKTLNPDYVFFQQPYNVAKCEAYKSWNVGKYATLVYVEYGYNSSKELGFECFPPDFLKNVSLLCTQSPLEDEWCNEWFERTNNHFTKKIITGFPRFDELVNYENCESDMWKTNDKSKFRIVWTPRWTTNENNCHFFDYKDKWIDYCNINNDVDFVFRPHPQAWKNYAANNNFGPEKELMYRKLYDLKENMNIDSEKNYIPLFYSSDVLVTDYSSVVVEYFLTGKPIIYCYRENSLYNPEGEWTKGFYYVHTWNELVDVLDKLRKNIDPLKKVREEYIKKCFYMPEKGAGYEIKELVKRHFRGEL